MTTGWKSNLMNASSRNTHYSKSLHQNVTRCFHFSPKCSKIVGGWGSAPDPAEGAYIILPLLKSMTHYSKSLHLMLPYQSKMQQNRWRLGLRPRPRWGCLHRPLMKSMTHYSESLHQMLPFLSKMHQHRWLVGPLGPTSILGPSAPSPPLAGRVDGMAGRVDGMAAGRVDGMVAGESMAWQG